MGSARHGRERTRSANEHGPEPLPEPSQVPRPKTPDRCGHEVLEHAKGGEALREIPVALFTASDRDEDVERSRPDDPRELPERLRTLPDHLRERPLGIARPTVLPG